MDKENPQFDSPNRHAGLEPAIATQIDFSASFCDLFKGSDLAHVKSTLAGQADQHGKVPAKYITVKRPADKAIWLEHLTHGGTAGVGIIPIRSDNSCLFGAIDIDVYPLDHCKLIKDVEELELPLIICRSKSGGAHCYIFLTSQAPAALVKSVLARWAKMLGFPRAEIFPKQDELAKDDLGNCINMPYRGGEFSVRYAYNSAGEAIEIEDFITLANSSKVTLEWLSNWTPPQIVSADSMLDGAPPCLKSLASLGFGDWQNSGLFNLAVYLRMRFPNDWHEKVEEYNCRYLDPPVAPKDVRSIIKSVQKKYYFYTCSQEPILTVCDKEACRSCKFGIGGSSLDLTSQIAKLNKINAVVWVGDRVLILRETVNSDGSLTIDFSSVGAFKTWMSNQVVSIDGRNVRIADRWLGHPRRRQYEGITFSPASRDERYYNLWRGFTTEPLQGDWGLFRDHLLQNVCNGNEELYNWFFAWWASLFQNPAEKIGTSIVIRGDEGTGKTKIGEVLGSLLGPHYLSVSDPRFITGRFNSHLASCLVLHGEEAFWAGDHTAEAKLKELITGHTHLIEYKGKEPISVPNLIRLFVTGNPDWLVPVSLDGRRFAVFEIGDGRKRDNAYFAQIDEQMDSGGREALLYDLLNFDLTLVNLRSVPKTAALLEQKLSSLTPEQRWWLDKLQSGRLPWGAGLPSLTPKSKLCDDYAEHGRKRGFGRRSTETRLGMFLRKMVPNLRTSTGLYRQEGLEHTGALYEFPPLAACRKAFERQLAQTIDWEGPEDWLEAPQREADPQGAPM